MGLGVQHYTKPIGSGLPGLGKALRDFFETTPATATGGGYIADCLGYERSQKTNPDCFYIAMVWNGSPDVLSLGLMKLHQLRPRHTAAPRRQF